MQQTIQRIRGFSDRDPAGQLRAATIIGTLLNTFQLADYAEISVPVLESLDLYVRKSGAQILPTIYGFVDQGKQEVALRPEFTASVIRAFGPAVAPDGPPLRVCYAGPVFRYESGEDQQHRQTTQAGVELLGAEGTQADAEILALACQAARAAGVPRLRLVIGHLGLLRAALAALEIEGYAEGYLLEHLEYFNRGTSQQQSVRRRLGLLDGDTPESDPDEQLPRSIAAAIRDVAPDEARRQLTSLLDGMGLSLEGSTRSPDEIIDRVLAKARRQAAKRSGRGRERLERALALVEALGSLRGNPSTILEQTAQLLARYGVPPSSLDGLRAVLDALCDHDLADTEVLLAPGMARGLAYYSGLIFELYALPAGGAAPIQICGGGRYDGLADALIYRSFPALGFSFTLERLLTALSPAQEPIHAPPRVAVLAGPSDDRALLQRLVQGARAVGLPSAICEAPPRQDPLAWARQAGYSIALRIDSSGPIVSALTSEASTHPALPALRQLASQVLAEADVPAPASAGGGREALR